MRGRILHLGVNWLTGYADIAKVDAALDQIAPDWLRYSPNTWLLYTDKSAQIIFDQMRPNFIGIFSGGLTDQFMVSTLDISQGVQGWMPQFVWDWINRPRDGGWEPPQPAPRLPLGSRSALQEALHRMGQSAPDVLDTADPPRLPKKS